MTIAVIGRGLIGSAAAKYLARAGREVVLIGPDEPADKALHRGVFASHYDEGRITRALDEHPYWSDVSRAAIARYRTIKTRSDVSFFTECGAVMAGPAGGAAMAGVAAVRAAGGIASDRLEGAALAERFPFFRFPLGDVAFHERTGAGHVSPRRLVQAQGQLAQAAGARVVQAEARALRPGGAGAVVETDAGPVAAREVLVAAGGFTDALLPMPLGLQVYARTVAFFRVAEAEQARLREMPTLVYRGRDGADPYLLPPIRYPDGQMYLKLGGDPVDVRLPDAAAAGDWFRSGGSAEVGAFLRARILERMPGLRIEAMHTQPCVTTFTPEDRPAIRRLSDWLSVAAAGCGRGAKCSDELGRLAAETVLALPVAGE